MSRFLFNLTLAAGLSCSVAAFAQTRNVMAGTFVPATTTMDDHGAMPQISPHDHGVYMPDILRTGGVDRQVMAAAPSQEFLNSVGR